MSLSHSNSQKTLRLIHGDMDQVVRFGNVSIQLAPQDRPPFHVDAVVVEQDTALLLDEEPVLNVPHSSLKQLGEEMESFNEPAPGSIVVQRGAPRRLYAIVHDLEQEPTWREEWILMALEKLLRLADQHPPSALAMPLLGSRFGALAPERFISLLHFAIAAFPPDYPLKLWLVVPRRDIHQLLLTLRHRAGK